jgi:hypothetical protein
MYNLFIYIIKVVININPTRLTISLVIIKRIIMFTYI